VDGSAGFGISLRFTVISDVVKRLKQFRIVFIFYLNR